LRTGIPLDERDEMIETSKRRDDDLPLDGRIGLVEASKEPAASIEIGRDVRWRLQRHGSAQPLK
jgi:hypothetical protein